MKQKEKGKEVKIAICFWICTEVKVKVNREVITTLKI